MKFKNVLVCTMAILPMFCAVESQAGFAEEYDKAMVEKKHNSEGYKNTQKLNDKQKPVSVKQVATFFDSFLRKNFKY